MSQPYQSRKGNNACSRSRCVVEGTYWTAQQAVEYLACHPRPHSATFSSEPVHLALEPALLLLYPRASLSMSATILSSSLLATPVRSAVKQRSHPRRTVSVSASYRGSGFNANDAFRQAAQQFEKFQKQQQSQQRSQGRGNAGRTEAFRGSYGPFQWNFDAEQMSKFMKVCARLILDLSLLSSSARFQDT